MSKTRLSIGTYQIHAPLEPILYEAWRKGCRFIDTAPNYREGRAEESIGEVLQSAQEKGIIDKKEAISVSTKVGFIPSHQFKDLLQKKVILEGDTSRGNNISPTYIRYQFNKSLKALGTKPEYLFLHNPEIHGQRLAKEEFLKVLYDAFEVLEDIASSHKLPGYGVATWEGFGTPKKHPLFTTRDLYQIALSVGGANHHFKVIQFPLNFVARSPLEWALKEKKGPLVEAQDHGLEVHISSPLHGGDVVKVLGKEFCQRLSKDASPALACLLFASSHPSVSRVLTSPSSLQHLNDSLKILKMEKLPPSDLLSLMDLFNGS